MYDMGLLGDLGDESSNDDENEKAEAATPEPRINGDGSGHGTPRTGTPNLSSNGPSGMSETEVDVWISGSEIFRGPRAHAADQEEATSNGPRTNMGQCRHAGVVVCRADIPGRLMIETDAHAPSIQATTQAIHRLANVPHVLFLDIDNSCRIAMSQLIVQRVFMILLTVIVAISPLASFIWIALTRRKPRHCDMFRHRHGGWTAALAVIQALAAWSPICFCILAWNEHAWLPHFLGAVCLSSSSEVLWEIAVSKSDMSLRSLRHFVFAVVPMALSWGFGLSKIVLGLDEGFIAACTQRNGVVPHETRRQIPQMGTAVASRGRSGDIVGFDFSRLDPWALGKVTAPKRNGMFANAPKLISAISVFVDLAVCVAQLRSVRSEIRAKLGLKREGSKESEDEENEIELGEEMYLWSLENYNTARLSKRARLIDRGDLTRCEMKQYKCAICEAVDGL
ncbi:hypothetical protein FALBO_10523 [Fusarium albosuccineum]|uniref:Uncharacterized protein n=1 Tax=Fusarium albosuccineum TaxID=1237068 RepID=A0A8H4P9Q0_9HYPO|nr:hypothetical protein FALBO_10523 [Fusarium albosuccineum]